MPDSFLRHLRRITRDVATRLTRIFRNFSELLLQCCEADFSALFAAIFFTAMQTKLFVDTTA
jgi:hypothetical protein